jgi:hypothetical protein
MAYGLWLRQLNLYFVAKLFWVDGTFPGRVAVCERPGAGGWLDGHLKSFRQAGVDILVSALTPWEAQSLSLEHVPERAQAAGLEFVSLPIANLGLPKPSDIDALRSLAAQVQAGRSLAAHCHASVGRSPLIVASILVLLGLELDDAWARINAVRGREVPDTLEQLRWPAQLLAGASVATGESAQ